MAKNWRLIRPSDEDQLGDEDTCKMKLYYVASNTEEKLVEIYKI